MVLAILVITIITVVLSPIIWWYYTLAKFKSLNKIPGPAPLPIIGNSREVGKTTIDLLQSFMALNRKYGSLMKIWLGPRLHLMITKPEVVEYFLSSNVHLSKSNGYDLFKPWLRDGLLVSTGAKWKARRKMITPTFHFKVLEKFLETFNSHINILIDILLDKTRSGNKSIEITHFINLCSLDIICETAFGTPLNAQHNFNPKYVDAVTGFLEIFTLRFFSAWLRYPLIFRLSKSYHKYVECLKILHGFTSNIIVKRRKEFEKFKDNPKFSEECIKRRAALLDMLLEVSENGQRLSDQDIQEEVDTFMFEGYDTASAATCWTLYAVAANPEIQEKVYDELQSVLGKDYRKEVTIHQLQDLKYFDIVVKEAIRMYPPVPIIERKLEEECKIEGVTVPMDTNISIFLYGMCHSPDVFPEPEKFDPDRFLPEKQTSRHNFAYVPFSAGPRNCIGQKFALLEVKATLAKLLRCFEVSTVNSAPPQVGMCSVLKSKNGINLKLKARSQ